VHALTAVLLKHDFGINFSMPLNHLCPPLPQRLNYIHWIADLLQSPQPKPGITGLDIGTGASCIFPLLGHLTFKWRFVGSEMDTESVAAAQANVDRNKLGEYIAVRSVERADHILRNVVVPSDRFDFTICNPPFFSSLEETGLNRNRGTTATSSELVCPGGEVQFLTTMVQQSHAVRDQISLFTSMVGKKTTLKMVKEALRPYKPGHITTTAFVQGKQTRWGIAWTFDEQSANQLRVLDGLQPLNPELETTVTVIAPARHALSQDKAEKRPKRADGNTMEGTVELLMLTRDPRKLRQDLVDTVEMFAAQQGVTCDDTTPTAGAEQFTRMSLRLTRNATNVDASVEVDSVTEEVKQTANDIGPSMPPWMLPQASARDDNITETELQLPPSSALLSTPAHQWPMQVLVEWTLQPVTSRHGHVLGLSSVPTHQGADESASSAFPALIKWIEETLPGVIHS